MGIDLDRPAVRTRWKPALITVAVIVLLTAGWPLINAALSGTRHLAADGTLSLGPDKDHRVGVVTPGPGWTLDQAASNPQLNYALSVGMIDMTVVYVPISASDADKVWPAVPDLVALHGGTLGPTRTVANSQGYPGESATLTEGARTGSVTSYVAPNKSFAVRYTILGPPDAGPADRAAAQRSVAAAPFIGGRQ